MKALIVSSEVHPYSKSGGLADMVGALAKFVARAGHPVEVITPLYAGIVDRFPGIGSPETRLDVRLGSLLRPAFLRPLRVDEFLTIHFVDHPGFFDRRELYQEGGIDYPDNAERFIFLSQAAAQYALRKAGELDVVHAHDWQTGLVPLHLHHARSLGAAAPPTCFTIHNLAYQGLFPGSRFALTNLPAHYFSPEGVEFYGQLNCLKAGIIYSDVITTVSPRYAREITTESLGCGLDGVLRARQNSIIGILNGVDYTEWKTVGNPHLAHEFAWDDLNGKQLEKERLQRDFGLPPAPDIPLFGTVARLVAQKGVDLLLGALEEMLAAEMQFVLLGSGAPQYESAFRDLARRFPTKVGVQIGFDQSLSHRVEAGCDFYLMPSRFEPCGLNQMYSLRYGTIPIVRVTGGLDDSVTDVTQDLAQANGIKFSEASVRALARAIRKALVLYQHSDLRRHYQENAMQINYSWERTAAEYIQVYESLVRARHPSANLPATVLT